MLGSLVDFFMKDSSYVKSYNFRSVVGSFSQRAHEDIRSQRAGHCLDGCFFRVSFRNARLDF